MLPPNVVMASLQEGFALLDKTKKKEMDVNGCLVRLSEAENGSLQLILTLKAFHSSLEAQYVFQINPIAIEKVVILEAQILDLQNSVRHLEAALQEKTRVVFSASSTKMVAPKNCVVWNNSHVYNDAYFDLSDDTTEVFIIERGLYEIQMTGRVHSWNDMVETVHCLVDGVCVAAAFVGESRLFGMNRVLLLEADARMMFVPCGKYNLEPGCSLSLVLVEEVPSNEEGVH
ncbi:hypothetical protein LEN26_014784 [Aphanomyces euteiches]|nr:hypothetical protein LEN26_014784 [Aphanomyces euteiches]KAH9115644.1 hypothetical protein AeMF1_010356 [Aphanomyces euteiches]